MKPRRFTRFWIFFIALATGLAAGNGLWGWGGRPHSVITRAALEALPSWEREIWKDLLPKIIEEYCLIPDFYLSRPDLAGYAILDDYQVKFTEYDYRIQQEFFIRNGHYHLPCDQKMNFRIYEFFLERIVSSLKAKKIEDAAKFAGVLLHVIEDFSAPSHSVTGDNQFYLFMQFLPPPEKFKYARLHGPIESGNISAKIPDYRPKLLGASPSEAAFHLHRLMNQNIIQARGKVIPIIQAIYREDAPAADAENSVMAARAAQVAADVLDSAFQIAYGRSDASELAALREFDISGLIPMEATDLAWRQPQSCRPVGYPTSNIILNRERQPLPLKLFTDRSGQRIETTFATGIAAGTRQSLTGEPCILSYIVPENVYDRFEAVAGLQSGMAVDGAVVFQVKGNDKVLFESAPFRRADPAVTIRVPLKGVKEIKLIAFPDTKDSADNYVVWGEPRFVKDVSIRK
jgi:hypothetical protein